MQKKTGNTEETEEHLEITTEKIILRAIERGLSLKDFEEMTVGMIIDFIVTHNNENLTEEEKEEVFKRIEALTSTQLLDIANEVLSENYLSTLIYK